MRKLIQALLTTLFVSAMPLQAAYATADDGNKDQTEQACSTVTFEKSFSPETRSALADKGGVIIDLQGDNAVAFMDGLQKLLGQTAPFVTDRVVIVRPNADIDTMLNIGYFKDNCLVNFGHLSPELLIKLIPQS